MGYPDELDKFELEVRWERRSQGEKWGEQNHPDGTSVLFEKMAEDAKQRCKAAAKNGAVTWKHILEEEVLEAFAEEDPESLKTELIQCAAVIKQWIECIDRRSRAQKAPRSE